MQMTVHCNFVRCSNPVTSRARRFARAWRCGDSACQRTCLTAQLIGIPLAGSEFLTHDHQRQRLVQGPLKIEDISAHGQRARQET